MIVYRHGSDRLRDLIESHDGRYRVGVNDCPFCDAGSIFSDFGKIDWLSEKLVREVVFTDWYFYKKGNAIVISQCPNCFKLSFHHWRLDWLLWRDWIDKGVVQAEIDRCHKEALEEWNRSLCKRCVHPKEIDRDPYGYWIKCKNRMGGPEQPDEKEAFKCKRFKEREE